MKIVRRKPVENLARTPEQKIKARRPVANKAARGVAPRIGRLDLRAGALGEFENPLKMVRRVVVGEDDVLALRIDELSPARRSQRKRQEKQRTQSKRHGPARKCRHKESYWKSLPNALSS